jgi:hypothetical protein
VLQTPDELQQGAYQTTLHLAIDPKRPPQIRGSQ